RRAQRRRRGRYAGARAPRPVATAARALGAPPSHGGHRAGAGADAGRAAPRADGPSTHGLGRGRVLRMKPLALSLVAALFVAPSAAHAEPPTADEGEVLVLEELLVE